MKKLLLIVFILNVINSSVACSMFKITKDSKTIVGNNEDYISLNTQMWFEPGEDGDYGYLNVGFLNGFPQGGINEAGLTVDGFAMKYLAVNNTMGKTEVSLRTMMDHIMHKYATVKEVKNYLKDINLSGLARGMIVFVDKHGEYLVVEGDELTIGNDEIQTFSNFYPSQTKSSSDVTLSYYQNGMKFINSSKHERSLDYCAKVMDHLSQEKNKIAATQYTTIYNLEDQKIRIYYYSDFENYIDIDLKEELSKGKHKFTMAEKLPHNTKAFAMYQSYNNEENPTAFLEYFWNIEKEGKGGETLKSTKSDFINVLNLIGYEWLYDKHNPSGASKIFEYGVNLAPSNANIYDSYAEALFNLGEHDKAILNYEKSLKLNPENNNAKVMINKSMTAIEDNKAKSEEDLIIETIMDYIDGTSYNQPERLDKAFYSDANLYLDKNDSLWVLPIKDYKAFYKNSPYGKFNGRIGKILSIDYFGNIAQAKAEILMPWRNMRYIDMFILKKINNKWKIISKTANSKESNKKGDKILFVVSNAHFYGDSDISTGNSLSEITNAYYEFEKAGYTLDFVSPEGGAIAFKYLDMSDSLQKKYIYDTDFMYALEHTSTPENINSSDYKAVYFVGGGASMYCVPDNKAIQKIAMEIYENNKGVISAVCHGTAGIVNLKTKDGKYLVDGKNISGYPDSYENHDAEYYKNFPFNITQTIENRGGTFLFSKRNTPHIEVAGQLITGQNHLSSRLVALEIIKYLKNQNKE